MVIAVQRGQPLDHIRKRGLECAALPLVDLVGEDGALRMRRGLGKAQPMQLVAAVIDDDDVGKARVDQTGDHLLKLQVGIE